MEAEFKRVYMMVCVIAKEAVAEQRKFRGLSKLLIRVCLSNKLDQGKCVSLKLDIRLQYVLG